MSVLGFWNSTFFRFLVPEIFTNVQFQAQEIYKSSRKIKSFYWKYWFQFIDFRNTNFSWFCWFLPITKMLWIMYYIKKMYHETWVYLNCLTCMSRLNISESPELTLSNSTLISEDKHKVTHHLKWISTINITWA